MSDTASTASALYVIPDTFSGPLGLTLSSPSDVNLRRVFVSHPTRDITVHASGNAWLVPRGTVLELQTRATPSEHPDGEPVLEWVRRVGPDAGAEEVRHVLSLCAWLFGH